MQRRQPFQRLRNEDATLARFIARELEITTRIIAARAARLEGGDRTVFLALLSHVIDHMGAQAVKDSSGYVDTFMGAVKAQMHQPRDFREQERPR